MTALIWLGAAAIVAEALLACWIWWLFNRVAPDDGAGEH